MANGLAEFTEFLEKNEAPRKAIEELSHEKKGKALDEAIVHFAAAAGFVFSVAELERTIEDGLARLLVDDDVSDQQLEDVAAEKQGCFGGWLSTLIFGRRAEPD